MLQIHKVILTLPRETPGQPASPPDQNRDQGLYEPILQVPKGGRFARTRRGDRFALLSEIRTGDIIYQL